MDALFTVNTRFTQSRRMRSTVLTEKPDVRAIALELLKAPTTRDLQVKVGASNFSQPCPRCLADDLLGGASDPAQERWAWAGAVVGTAIHNLLEERVRELHPEWVPEQKLYLGHLVDYGDIKSRLDLYLPPFKTLIDWKSTTKKKLVFLKEATRTEPNELEVSDLAAARYKINSYLNQLMSYGRGLILAGHEVEWVSIVFICRDAVGDKDIWDYTVPYDAEQAEAVWDRLVRLWEALRNGLDPATLPSAQGCYYCENVRGR